jgi:PhzF family phenazine biosynthesis protein
MNKGTLYRLAAFAEKPGGGNPAGVWIGKALPDEATMQQIAAEVGYSETAFVAPERGTSRAVRYFSPEREVPFCGHATIAAGAVMGTATAETTYALSTTVGIVPVTVRSSGQRTEVSLTSVETKHKSASDELLEEALSALGWRKDELDSAIPPAIAYAGAWHLVIAVVSAKRLAHLDYDFEKLKALMLREDLTTLQLVWHESDVLFHSRNPFPVGGVVEDPATGAAAAAFGGYLRDAGLVAAPAHIEIRQGETMGRPSLLNVHVPENGGIIVSGSVVEI